MADAMDCVGKDLGNLHVHQFSKFGLIVSGDINRFHDGRLLSKHSFWFLAAQATILRQPRSKRFRRASPGTLRG
jgi:hypothetical protein